MRKIFEINKSDFDSYLSKNPNIEKITNNHNSFSDIINENFKIVKITKDNLYKCILADRLLCYTNIEEYFKHTLGYALLGENNKIIGEAHVDIIDDEAEVAIAVIREFRNKGFANILCAVLFQILFQSNRIKVVFATVRQENISSVSVFSHYVNSKKQYTAMANY